MTAGYRTTAGTRHAMQVSHEAFVKWLAFQKAFIAMLRDWRDDHVDVTQSTCLEFLCDVAKAYFDGEHLDPILWKPDTAPVKRPKNPKGMAAYPHQAAYQTKTRSERLNRRIAKLETKEQEAHDRKTRHEAIKRLNRKSRGFYRRWKDVEQEEAPE